MDATRWAAIEIFNGHVGYPPRATSDKFHMTSAALAAGGDTLYPYPATENWQKALGGHTIWIDAEVDVTCDATRALFKLDMVLHMEDRYNFNPGSKDQETRIKDEENGRFEVTKLCHEFDVSATFERHVEFPHLLGPNPMGNTNPTPKVTKSKRKDITIPQDQ